MLFFVVPIANNFSTMLNSKSLVASKCFGATPKIVFHILCMEDLSFRHELIKYFHQLIKKNRILSGLMTHQVLL